MKKYYFEFLVVVYIVALAVISFGADMTNTQDLSTSEVIVPRRIIVKEIEKPIHRKSVKRKVTAYTAKETCPSGKCVTASGIRPTPVTVACPRAYKLGTKIFIESVGVKECHDRTALKNDGTFDIWLGDSEEAHEAAKQFGVKKLEVYVLSK